MDTWGAMVFGGVSEERLQFNADTLWTGLRARGGFTVDLAWKDGKLTGATLHCTGGTMAKVRCADKTADIEIPASGTLRLGPDLAPR